MPRKRRKESITGFYHVIARGINKELIFNQTREKLYLKRILKEILSDHNVEIYAYVNVNIKMLKKWNIKMYIFPRFIPQPELP